MNNFKLVIGEHVGNIEKIFQMAIIDLKKQYSGTVLGVLWSIIKNIIFVFAYWFTISIGLKGASNVKYPYMAWLVTGLAAWFFIRDTLAPAASSIRRNKYLVSKMVFPISIIPTFKVIASGLSSLMFVVIVFGVAWASGISPSIYWIQIIYYHFAAAMLLIAISLCTSALVVMSKDIEMLINSTIFLIFWLSPILYPVANLSAKLAFMVKLNPFYYIIEGFRASVLYNVWFWEQPILTLYFWGFTIMMMFIGIFVHGRLRNQFVDVL